MNLDKIFNIFFFSLDLKNLLILLKKIYRRLFDKKDSLNKNELIKLYDTNQENCIEFLNSIDSNLLKESIQVYKKYKKINNSKLKNVKFNLGGGGFFELIYFFVRLKKTEFNLETGVGAGHSSLSILLAIEKNKKGILYSSDLPYFRYKKPLQYVGILVPDHLKKYWKIYTKGDEFNLKEILKKISKFDFIHYDSDKSYNGRIYFFEQIKDYINESTLIIMDDIQDNTFFYDYIIKNNEFNYKIFKHEKKFIGLIYKKLI